jgi:hypothetical protein
MSKYLLYTIIYYLISIEICDAVETVRALDCSVTSIDLEFTQGKQDSSQQNNYDYIIEFTSQESANRYDKNGTALGTFRVTTTGGMYTLVLTEQTINPFGEHVETAETFHISRLTGKIEGIEDIKRGQVRFYSTSSGTCKTAVVEPRL